MQEEDLSPHRRRHHHHRHTWKIIRKQLSLQASQGPLMREGCGVINVADERKIKAVTSRRLSLVWDSRPRRADGSDNEDEHREPSMCVVRWHASFLYEKVLRTSTGKNEGEKTSNNAGRFADRAEALAGEICGLFMKTRRGGSRRRGKQSVLGQ